MEKIGMDKATGQKAIPLPVIGNGRRVKNEVVENFIVTKRGN
jgi:hypothetical protein